MSVKRIIIVGISTLALIAFIVVGIADAVKTKDKLDLQQVELKSRSTEIKRLDKDYDLLNQELDKAKKDKKTNEAEVKKLEEERQRLEEEKERLQQEVSVLKERKLAKASTKVLNTATGTQVAHAAEAPQSRGAGSYSHSEIKAIIFAAANKHGLDPNWFYNLAKCESTWNPNAVNYNYYDNGHPSGLFQHISGYWPARAAQYGYAGASVFDPVANANVTAAMWRSGSHLWECQ